VQPIKATRGNIRTYNGFVADTTPQSQYMGAEAAWVALAGKSTITGKAVGAQVGFAKTPPDGHPFDPVFFLQYTDSNGNYFPAEFYGTGIFAPTVYNYYVRWIPGSGGGKLFEFVANNTHLLTSTDVVYEENHRVVRSGGEELHR